MPTLTDWVAAFAQELSKRIGEKRYHLWFAQQTRIELTDKQLTIGVPNRFFLDWLQATFAQAIQAAAETVAGHPLTVRFVVDPALFQAQRRQQSASNMAWDESETSPNLPSSAVLARDGKAADSARANPRRAGAKLDDFLVGESNRLAYAAVTQLVQGSAPEKAWFGNSAPRLAGVPLTIYGPHGVGKTHLLEGLAEALMRQHEPGKVLCLTAEDFTNQFLQSLRQSKLEEFRRRFRQAAALLVDDLQFLEGKRATQEELLHTLATLSRQGRIFVATCEYHPRQARWIPELIDRLAGGAVWPIELPDPSLRQRLLHAKAQKLGSPLSAEVAEYLAQRVQGNVRELEGALYAVWHYATVHHRPVTLELAQEALSRWLRPQPKTVSLRDVERAVSRVLHLRPGTLRGRERVRSASYPRMLAMYLARKHTGLPYHEIGRFFGGRNHSTVIAAERKVSRWLTTQTCLRLAGQSWNVAELVEHIEREL
ncbi:MAG: DnaA/Hda family protein [Gemmatales bacterium]|nr:DnaA/Hda family protein [Gemmatales bacterium]MDW7995182.1 DnaA/Hda family protein [Gemmatales bacterium]